MSQQNDVIERYRDSYAQALLHLLQVQLTRLGKSVPDLVEANLVRQAPYLLEESSKSRLEQSRGQNRFVILFGPPGGGKGAAGDELEKIGFRRLKRVMSRAPRPDEVPGKDNDFVDNRTFEGMIERGELIYWAKRVNRQTGNDEYWGVAVDTFLDLIRQNQRFYIEGSTRAHRDFAANPEVQKYPYLVISLLPPSYDTLMDRFLRRETEEGPSKSPRDLSQRLDEIISYLRRVTEDNVEYIWLVNDNLERIRRIIEENF